MGLLRTILLVTGFIFALGYVILSKYFPSTPYITEIVGILGIIGIGWPVLLQIVDQLKQNKEKSRDITQEFEKYFESVQFALSNGSLGSPQQIVYSGADFKLPQANDLQELIESHINTSKKENFHIFNICGQPRQGKSILFWEVAKKLSESTRSKKKFECKSFRKELTIENMNRLTEFIEAIKNYSRIKRKYFLIIFWEDLFKDVSCINSSYLNNDTVFWRYLCDKIKPNTKVIIITTSVKLVRLHQNSTLSSDRDLNYVWHFPYRLTKYLAVKILNKYAETQKISENAITDFLKQPALFDKCRGNISYLLLLFEQSRRKGSSVVDPFLDETILDDTTRVKKETYNKWIESHDDTDKEKASIVGFVSLCDLLGISLPEEIYSYLSVLQRKELQDGFLSLINDCLSIVPPYLGYIILKDESDAKTTGDFENYLFDIVNKRTSLILRHLVNVPDFSVAVKRLSFVRDIIHFIDEEKYRPIISKTGHGIAKRLYEAHQGIINDFIDKRLIREAQNNSQLVYHIRRWASTFRRLNLWNKAESLYETTATLLGDTVTEQNIGLQILLARGLSKLSPRHKNQAAEIYCRLSEAKDMIPPDRIISGLLDPALNLFKLLRRQEQGLELMDKIGEWQKDALLCIRRADFFKKLGNLNDAESCFRTAAKLIVNQPITTGEAKAKRNYLQNYALFIIRHWRKLPKDNMRPTVESLLTSAQDNAKEMNDGVEGVLTAWAEYYDKIIGDRIQALASYRKAVEWCEINGIPNPRPYTQLATYLRDNAHFLSSDPALYLQEAEKCARKVIEADDFDSSSKNKAYNALGLLVGGRSKMENAPNRYTYEGKQRPDYDEAIGYLKESFESETEFTESAPDRKTWQDVRTHNTLADIFREKAHKENRKSEEKECWDSAERHAKAAYEGLPREDLKDIEVKEHVLRAMDNHALIHLEMANRKYSSEAENIWQSAINKMEGGDFKDIDLHWVGYLIYFNYANFLWKTELKVHTDNKNYQSPWTPLESITGAPPIDIIKKSMEYYTKALSVLSSQRKDYNDLYYKANHDILILTRSLAAHAIRNKNGTESIQWIKEFLGVSNRSLGILPTNYVHRQSLIKHINDFLDGEEVQSYIAKDRNLKELKEKYLSFAKS